MTRSRILQVLSEAENPNAERDELVLANQGLIKKFGKIYSNIPAKTYGGTYKYSKENPTEDIESVALIQLVKAADHWLANEESFKAKGYNFTQWAENTIRNRLKNMFRDESDRYNREKNNFSMDAGSDGDDDHAPRDLDVDDEKAPGFQLGGSSSRPDREAAKNDDLKTVMAEINKLPDFNQRFMLRMKFTNPEATMRDIHARLSEVTPNKISYGYAARLFDDGWAKVSERLRAPGKKLSSPKELVPENLHGDRVKNFLYVMESFSEQVDTSTVKNPWELTQTEFATQQARSSYGSSSFFSKNSEADYENYFRMRHYEFVRAALQRGEHVPADVLADYPDLAGR